MRVRVCLCVCVLVCAEEFLYDVVNNQLCTGTAAAAIAAAAAAAIVRSVPNMHACMHRACRFYVRLVHETSPILGAIHVRYASPCDCANVLRPAKIKASRAKAAVHVVTVFARRFGCVRLVANKYTQYNGYQRATRYPRRTRTKRTHEQPMLCSFHRRRLPDSVVVNVGLHNRVRAFCCPSTRAQKPMGKSCSSISPANASGHEHISYTYIHALEYQTAEHMHEHEYNTI